MSGYCNYSKSNNALDAESQERFPLTQAAKVLAKKINWTIAKAQAFLKEKGTTEWHHTSARYNITDYYNVSDERLADMQEQLAAFVFVAEKKETTVFFKCWNFHRDHCEPRKLEWSITSRVGNYTHSLESVRATMLSVKETLQRAYVSGHKTHDRIFAQNIAAIEEILAALT